MFVQFNGRDHYERVKKEYVWTVESLQKMLLNMKMNYLDSEENRDKFISEIDEFFDLYKKPIADERPDIVKRVFKWSTAAIPFLAILAMVVYHFVIHGHQYSTIEYALFGTSGLSFILLFIEVVRCEKHVSILDPEKFETNIKDLVDKINSLNSKKISEPAERELKFKEIQKLMESINEVISISKISSGTIITVNRINELKETVASKKQIEKIEGRLQGIKELIEQKKIDATAREGKEIGDVDVRERKESNMDIQEYKDSLFSETFSYIRTRLAGDKYEFKVVKDEKEISIELTNPEEISALSRITDGHLRRLFKVSKLHCEREGLKARLDAPGAYGFPIKMSIYKKNDCLDGSKIFEYYRELLSKPDKEEEELKDSFSCIIS